MGASWETWVGPGKTPGGCQAAERGFGGWQASCGWSRGRWLWEGFPTWEGRTGEVG